MFHDIFKRIEQPLADKKTGAEIPDNRYYQNNNEETQPARHIRYEIIYLIK